MNKTLIHSLRTKGFFLLRSKGEKHFYRVLGMRRSGNHAILNWVQQQMPGYTCVLDNMMHHPPQNTLLKKIRFRGFDRPNLLVSHEDRELTDFFLGYDEKLFGRAKRQYTILILRDPYNWIASWYAWQGELGSRFREETEFRKHTIGLWKEYARLFVEWRSLNEESKVPLNYNRWTQDFNYRKELAEKLDLKFTDKGREEVSLNGYGSSFSGLDFQGKGSQMDVLNRWQRFAEDETFLSFFDEEILRLGREVFPESDF